jgi:hypothetical protein
LQGFLRPRPFKYPSGETRTKIPPYGEPSNRWTSGQIWGRGGVIDRMGIFQEKKQ